MSIAVSVIVPTYHRDDLLARCLERLDEQNFSKSAYEILVADDGHSASTRALVEDWATQRRKKKPLPLIRYIEVEGRGPAAARNSAWRRALAPVVAFTDDDCLPSLNWLQEGMKIFRDGDSEPLHAAWGRLVMPVPKTPTDYELNAAQISGKEFVTANCFCRKQVLQEVGGFDERFTAAWREDSDLFFTLLQRGYRVIPASRAIVIHPVRPAGWGVSLRQQSKILFDALLFKKHPTLYRRKIRRAPPWNYYAMVATLLASAIGAVAHPWLALISFGVWAFLTADFCRRRLERTSRAVAHVAEMIATSILIPPLAVYWRIKGALRYRVLFL